ncbi:MAG: sulfatase-like hydrolase/transferase [Candidatus Helarchaeota archaeon]|nr:sulfatase-like hydrolase/transferase [Candidatus Helarchaeota archaeon]
MNVLFIITDQQRADHLSCAGNPILKTPNIDSIAKNGVRFTNYFCTNPMCMPNRATLFTGLYPNMHGVRCNGINLPTEVPTITHTLRKKGYHTISIGKIHFQHYSPVIKRKAKSWESMDDWTSEKKGKRVRENFPLPYYGFNEVEITLGHGDIITGHYQDWLKEKAPQHSSYLKKRLDQRWMLMRYLYDETELPEEYFPTSYVTERIIAFLERFVKGNYDDKSFFLHCSIPDPHHPACPPGKYKNMYKPEDLQLPPNFIDINNLSNHNFLSNHIKKSNLKDQSGLVKLLEIPPEEKVRKFISYTYGSIALIDYNVGKILTALKNLGLEKNTMVIFTSDHGDLMGDHGLTLKGPVPFKGVLNIPLIWKVPGLTKNAVSSSLVSSVDIPKTILNLLGIRDKILSRTFQGFNITPILKDPNQKIRDCCLVEEDEEGGFLKTRLRHLITENYKLTIYENFENFGDLYNRDDDPREINNLWNDAKFKDIRDNLLRKMLHESLKIQSRYPETQANII